MREEQKELKSVLNQELGLYKNDSSINKDPQPVKEYDFQLEWEELEADSGEGNVHEEPATTESRKVAPPEEKKKKKKFGKFLDKVTESNEDEYEEYNEEDY